MFIIICWSTRLRRVRGQDFDFSLLFYNICSQLKYNTYTS